MRRIYLDHNATTPLLSAVAAAMAECDAAGLANPASQHEAGRRARQALETAREGIGEILGARLSSPQSDRVIFTSGGTEANNLALFGLAGREPCRLIVSAIEHPSVAEPAKELKRRGFDVHVLPLSRNGVVDIGRLEQFMTPPTRLVSIMLGNNETGVMQPVREAAEICRRRGVLIHTDAVQVAGKLPVDFHALGVDAMSVAAHKFHGPRGIGALVVRHGVALQPVLFGGFQQEGFRPGTESVTLAVGMHAALRLWAAEREARIERMTRLRDKLDALLVAGWPGALVHGRDAPRLPHTTSISFPGLDRQKLVMALDLNGVECSSGSACASGSTDPSATLVAMGVSQAEYDSAVRFSLGATTTEEEIDEATATIRRVLDQLRRAK
ncbi:MAG: cysteine desulfurase [Planctomycetia bacterium]|nr:cysteine desulfurase [Planctomycetia bacterium]